MTAVPARHGDAVEIPGDYQYQATYHGYRPQRFWHQTRFEASLDMLGIRPGMRLLDIGCGSGVFAARAAREPRVQVVAIDANASAIQFARQQFPQPNLEFQVGLLADLDFPDASFDRISLLEVIEHIYEHQAVQLFEALARLLRPGGRLVVSTPNASSLWPVIEWLLDRLRLVAPMSGDQHVRLYNARRLRSIGEVSGLRLVESRTLFIGSPAVALVSWSAARWLASLERRTPWGSLLFQSWERPVSTNTSARSQAPVTTRSSR